MTDEERHEKLKKRREAYQRKKVSGKTPKQKAAKCAQEKKRYANMQTEKKKARMEQIEAHRQLKRNTLSKDSIAMENPEYVATEQEESTSTFTVKHRDHVAAGERQALLHRRNEEFTRRRKQAISVSSKEDESMTETCNENTQPLEQPQVMTYDIPSSMFPSIRETDTPTQSLYNDDHGKVTMWKDIPCTMLPTIKEVHARIQSLCNDGIIYEQEETIKEIDAAAKSMCNEDQGNDGVIFEEDTDEDEYMFTGEEWGREVEIEIIEDEEDLNPDPYDLVYGNIPTSTDVLEKEEDCCFCHATKFKYESQGLCCKKGQIRLANPNTPPELMRLWTSNDSDARHFRQNIRFFNGHFSFTTLYCQLDRDTTDMQTAEIGPKNIQRANQFGGSCSVD
ncbi:hypothetical protein ACQJBY_058440 [Aegilops geniculata]